MKKTISIFFVTALFSCFTLFAACGTGTADGALAEFTDILFENETVTYDGEPHSLAVRGTLPDGTDVDYQNNGKTDAGTYTVTATLSKEGYETLQLTALLTIEKAQFPAGITLESARVLYDGKPHSLTVSGPLPEGTDVTYQNNEKTDAGTYTVTATLTNPNYETKTLTASLEIYTVTQAASAILADILDRPEPWAFLPAALAPENMAYAAMPANGQVFQNDVNVNQIGTRTIGKQLNVLYDGISQANTALTAANAVFTAGEAIVSAYQNFIDGNPEGFDEFTGSVSLGGITFRLRIAVDGERVTLLAGNGTVSAELISDRSESAPYRNEGRIQITDGVALKYRMSDTSLKFAVRFTVNGIGIVQQIEFVRSSSAVLGYLYEFYGTDSAAIKTSALLYSDEDITAVLSDKRESNDLQIDAFEEVYDSKTGEMLGGEVAETVALVDYDTLWFNLYDVSGLSTVRVAQDTDGDDNIQNPHIVYVNGANTPFLPEYNTLPVIGTRTSRHYDIEMREVWYYISKTENGDTVYEKQKAEIPMLFVQRENADDFSAEVIANNANLSGATLPSDIRNSVTGTFGELYDTYSAIKEEITFTDINDFIGENDSFFDAA